MKKLKRASRLWRHYIDIDMLRTTFVNANQKSRRSRRMKTSKIREVLEDKKSADDPSIVTLVKKICKNYSLMTRLHNKLK